MPANTSTDRRRASVDVAGPGLVALLIIQVIIGYEWLTSGITKVASGDFASGLAADLKDKSGTQRTGTRASSRRSIASETSMPVSRTPGG